MLQSSALAKPKSIFRGNEWELLGANKDQSMVSLSANSGHSLITLVSNKIPGWGEIGFQVQQINTVIFKFYICCNNHLSTFYREKEGQADAGHG